MDNISQYPPALAELLRGDRLPELGPGTPDRAAYGALQALDVAGAFEPHPVRDREMARACLAGLWLRHDFLEESHAISQEIHTPTGSYWHGIMHRREPDYGNSKYWFRRVGEHPVFPELAAAAAALGYGGGGAAWDPFAFVDACQQAARQGGAAGELCRRVQKAEWELLFAWCYRQAVGAG